MHENERYLPNSDLLRTFLVIAECGNLTQAALRLNRTQSSISVQLRKLEETLATVLFERQARGMRLTESGEKLLPLARRSIQELKQISGLFRTNLQGRLRVGIPDDFDETVLEAVLASFGQSHPGVELITQSGCTSHYPGAIRRGELDIAVCSAPDITDGTLLSQEPTVWAAAETLILEEGAPVPLAVLDRDCWWRDMPGDALDEAGVAWRVSYKSSSFPSLKAAIRAGLAIGALPAQSVEPTMRVLSEADGVPALPISRRAILTGADAPAELTSAMTQALQGAVARF